MLTWKNYKWLTCQKKCYSNELESVLTVEVVTADLCFSLYNTQVPLERWTYVAGAPLFECLTITDHTHQPYITRTRNRDRECLFFFCKSPIDLHWLIFPLYDNFIIFIYLYLKKKVWDYRKYHWRSITSNERDDASKCEHQHIIHKCFLRITNSLYVVFLQVLLLFSETHVI